MIRKSKMPSQDDLGTDDLERAFDPVKELYLLKEARVNLEDADKIKAFLIDVYRKHSEDMARRKRPIKDILLSDDDDDTLFNSFKTPPSITSNKLVI